MTSRAPGRFFEDFELGALLKHPTPRTVHGGDLSLYIAATGDRRPLHSSTEVAKSLGHRREVVHDLLVFHIVFGKSVEDISKNAVANLGYADVRFVESVYPGDTLRAQSEVVGLRETSSGKSGVVYVKTTGYDQREREVMSFYRWVLVHKRDAAASTGPAHVPQLPEAVAIADVPVPSAIKLERFPALMWTTGGQRLWEDYAAGEIIAHSSGMTIDEADHLFLTRLYQNGAKVHFDAHAMKESRFGRRLVYGGHVISVAHALSYSGLENTLGMSAWNSGVHANPTFAGDTIYAQSRILEVAEVPGRDDLGALRIRLLACKDFAPGASDFAPRGDDGKVDPRVVLDLDYWSLIPRRPAKK
jgi:2-methylfumaryl-CoA hydratase